MYIPAPSEGSLFAPDQSVWTPRGAPLGLYEEARATPRLGSYGLSMTIPGGAAACPLYNRGEVETSRTARGHLAEDVSMFGGNLLIADFGVDWRHVKQSTMKEPLLREWLPRFESNPAYRLKVLGYSDCVGPEKNNEVLRRSRALNVVKLLGPGTKSRVESAMGAPLGTYVNDNSTAENRARNRSVVIEFKRDISFEPEVILGRCPIRTVKIWLNAFIPREVKGLTREIPDWMARAEPSLAGKTMIVSKVAGCFLTDQRSFSSDIRASSRMHSEAEIDLINPRIVYQHHCTFPTVEVNCMFGKIKCSERSGKPCNVIPSGPTGPMSFSDLRAAVTRSTVGKRTIYVRLKGSKGPACTGLVPEALVPKIDYEGYFSFELPAPNKLRLSFIGHVDLFPAYEMYAVVNRSNPVPLFRVLPAPGSSPVTHLETRADAFFYPQITLHCRGGKEIAELYRLAVRGGNGIRRN